MADVTAPNTFCRGWRARSLGRVLKGIDICQLIPIDEEVSDKQSVPISLSQFTAEDLQHSSLVVHSRLLLSLEAWKISFAS